MRANVKARKKAARPRLAKPQHRAQQPNWAKDAPKAAEVLVWLCSRYGVRLDYSPRSLRLVDQLITERANGSPANLDVGKFLLIAGSYVGEVIVRNLGGTWQTSTGSDPVEQASVKLSNGGVCFPMDKVARRFRNGEVDSVAFFFTGLQSVLKRHPRPLP